MTEEIWEKRVEDKLDKLVKDMGEIHERVMRKPGRQPGYKPRKTPKEEKKEEGGGGSPVPSPQS